MPVDLTTSKARELAASGRDFEGDLDSGRFAWLPCDAPGCWGASMHKGTACSRGPCTKNTGRRDPAALENALRSAGPLVTCWVED